MPLNVLNSEYSHANLMYAKYGYIKIKKGISDPKIIRHLFCNEVATILALRSNLDTTNVDSIREDLLEYFKVPEMPTASILPILALESYRFGDDEEVDSYLIKSKSILGHKVSEVFCLYDILRKYLYEDEF